jgi:hypothetical protein
MDSTTLQRTRRTARATRTRLVQVDRTIKDAQELLEEARAHLKQCRQMTEPRSHLQVR